MQHLGQGVDRVDVQAGGGFERAADSSGSGTKNTLAPAFSTATVFWATPPTSPILPVGGDRAGRRHLPPAGQVAARERVEEPERHGEPRRGPADVGGVDRDREREGEVLLGRDARPRGSPRLPASPGSTRRRAPARPGGRPGGSALGGELAGHEAPDRAEAVLLHGQPDGVAGARPRRSWVTKAQRWGSAVPSTAVTTCADLRTPEAGVPGDDRLDHHAGVVLGDRVAEPPEGRGLGGLLRLDHLEVALRGQFGGRDAPGDTARRSAPAGVGVAEEEEIVERVDRRDEDVGEEDRAVDVVGLVRSAP